MTLKKRHFTLIELLVVMGLIGLLVSLAVPSFTRLAKGKAVPAAADQIKRQLEEAQALAIANRSYVGLVIINGTENFNSITSDSDDLAAAPDLYALASTRPAFLFKDGEYYFDKWAPGSSWSKPIENARIVEVTDDYSNIPDVGGEKDWSKSIEKTTSKLSSPLSKLIKKTGVRTQDSFPTCCVVFAPDGGLDSGSDMFLFISGCTVSGSAITFADKNTDYMILHINRLSGKTVYFTKPDTSNAGDDSGGIDE